jgi:hypothetical protein
MAAAVVRCLAVAAAAASLDALALAEDDEAARTPMAAVALIGWRGKRGIGGGWESKRC